MIREVSQTLIALVEKATPDLGSWVALSSLSAADPDPPADRLAVALYAVDVQPETLNRLPASSGAAPVRPKPALRLHYLLTYVGDHAEAHSRTQRVISVLHTTPVIGAAQMSPVLAAEVEALTVRLVTTTADERHHVWAALGRPARLALFCTVDVAPAEPTTPAGPDVVPERRIERKGPQ